MNLALISSFIVVVVAVVCMILLKKIGRFLLLIKSQIDFLIEMMGGLIISIVMFICDLTFLTEGKVHIWLGVINMYYNHFFLHTNLFFSEYFLLGDILQL